MRQMLTQAQPEGQYFNNSQIKEMTITVNTEDDVVKQQTKKQRKRYSQFNNHTQKINHEHTEDAVDIVIKFTAIKTKVYETRTTQEKTNIIK